MSYPGDEERARSSYLLPREVVVLFARRHWVVMLEPVLTAVAGLAVVLGASVRVGDAASGRAVDLLWWCWFALVGRALFRVWEWRREYFVATDRRLLLIYGVIVRKVAMMPLKKVTDLVYHRSVPGRLLGYGTFELESAGQDQALRTLHHVNRPDETYRAIMGVIFRREGDAQPGAPEVLRVLPEDTTEQGSLARLQSLLPTPRRSRRWGRRRNDPASGSDVASDVTVEPVTERNRDVRGGLLRDSSGRPLSGGRPMYSSGEGGRPADTGWHDDDDD